MHFRRSRHLFEQLGWIKMASSSMIYLGLIATQTGRVEEASELLIESLTYEDREQDGHSIAHLLFVFGLLAIQRGDYEIGSQIFEAAEAMQQELDVAFPLHLTSAVDQAKRNLESIDLAPTPQVLTSGECVRYILTKSPDWLTELRDGIQDRS